MKYLLLVLFFFSIFILQAQDINFLMEKVAQMPDDTTKLNVLNIISEEAPDPVWTDYNRQAYNLAKQLTLSPDKKIRRRAFLGVADAYNNFGYELETKGEYQKAMEYWKKALKISVEQKDPKRTAVIYNNLGYVNYKMANYKEAVQHFNKSIKYKENLSDSTGMANTLVNIGSIYNALGDYKQAHSYYSRALRIYEKKNIQDKIGIVYINLGNCNIKNKDYKNARTYFNAAREVYLKQNNISGIANSNLHLGIISLDFEKDITKAYELFNEALSGFETISDSNKIHVTRTYLAKILDYYNRSEEAYLYSKSATDFFDKTFNCVDMIRAATVHHEVCKKTGRKDEAAKIAEILEFCQKKVKETPVSELNISLKQ